MNSGYKQLTAVLLSAAFFLMPVCASGEHLPTYAMLSDFTTVKLDEPGQPFMTSGSVVSSIDAEKAGRLLLTESFYNMWVIPGLNAPDDSLKPPMALYNRIETSKDCSELYLYFNLVSPLRIEDIRIPFVFSRREQIGPSTVIELEMKNRNIAVRHASLKLTAADGCEGTLLSADLLIDFSLLVDLILNQEVYANNTEERLRLCLENFLSVSLKAGDSLGCN
jgi:hypothetical protein